MVPWKGKLSPTDFGFVLCQLDDGSALEVWFAVLQVSDVLICDEGITFCDVFPELGMLRERIDTSSPPSQSGNQLEEDVFQIGGKEVACSLDGTYARSGRWGTSAEKRGKILRSQGPLTCSADVVQPTWPRRRHHSLPPSTPGRRRWPPGCGEGSSPEMHAAVAGSPSCIRGPVGMNEKISGCILGRFQRFFLPHCIQCLDFQPSRSGNNEVNGKREQIGAFPGLQLGGHLQVKLLTLCVDSSYYILHESTTTNWKL